MNGLARFGLAITSAYATFLTIFVGAGWMVHWDKHSVMLPLGALVASVLWLVVWMWVFEESDFWIDGPWEVPFTVIGFVAAVFCLVAVAIMLLYVALFAAFLYALGYLALAIFVMGQA